ncbi:MAG: multiple antibiotic resistance protein [Desulfovibrionales bacterium]|nr:multiple antibiotic resistance protein [Desulfovibrionales bacterium]
MQSFLSIFIKFFFLFTPFFVLSVFLSLTQDDSPAKRRLVAIRVSISVLIISLALYYFGNAIFSIFGLTLDAFRIGAGSLLFLSAVSLVSGKASPPPGETEGDVSVVPLAIPVTVGPATIGALLIMGASHQTILQRIMSSAALAAAVVCVGAILLLAQVIERVLGRYGISILTKITGLILSALAAQIVFTGIKGFLG